MDWKHDLYKKVAPFIAPNAIFASNTSGLSITALSEGFDAQLKARFCGMHFFNPPRYMHLVELIPTATTSAQILDQLEGFLTTTLGKGVVRAKDTPNFIANRVGIFGMLATMHEAETIRPLLRRGGRPHRRQARPRQVRHFPHRRRGRPGHHGPCDQDHAGQSRRRSVFRGVQDAGSAVQAGAGGRARPEERRRLLQESRQGHPAPGFRQGRIRRRRRQGGRARRAHTQREGSRQAHEDPARIEKSAGAVPVGDLPRYLPLHRRASGIDRRQRARRRFRHALGLWPECRPVRVLAGRRLAAGRGLDQGRHRCGQGAVQGAAAGLGVRRPQRRARARRLVLRRAQDQRAAFDAAGL